MASLKGRLSREVWTDSFFLFLCEFLKDSKECSVFSISAICLPAHLYSHPIQQLFIEHLLCARPIYWDYNPWWDRVPLSLYLFVFLFVSALCFFFSLCFSLPLPLKQTLVGLGPSVSVFGKRFDCSVRCYKSLNRARQICICDPFPKKKKYTSGKEIPT